MTGRVVTLGGSDWSDGEVNFAADKNDTFNIVSPAVMIMDTVSDGKIFSGSTLNHSGTSSSTNTDTLQISATELRNVNFVEIQISAAVSASSDGTQSGSITLQIERNETGEASFSDVLATTTIVQVNANPGISDTYIFAAKYLVATTAGERTNGIDIKFTTVGGSTGAGGTNSFTLQQIYFRGGN